MQNSGYYAVQGHSRSPIFVPIELSKAHMRCTVSKLWLIIYQIFASDRGSLHFHALGGGDSLRILPWVIYRHHHHPRISSQRNSWKKTSGPLKTSFFVLHFTHRMYLGTFNHFYAICANSYRIRWNNANYTAITPFKVIQGTDFGTNRKPLRDFLLVINTILPSILRRFQVMAVMVLSNFRYRVSTWECLTLAPPLGVIPANIRINFTLQKLQKLSYQMLKTTGSYLHSSGHNTGSWWTDGRTDGIPLACTALCIASKCGRAVKTPHCSSCVRVRGSADFLRNPCNVFIDVDHKQCCQCTHRKIVLRAGDAPDPAGKDLVGATSRGGGRRRKREGSKKQWEGRNPEQELSGLGKLATLAIIAIK